MTIMRYKSRAQALLESYDDVITGMMQQMDNYAQQSGGYINRMHPDQFDGESGERRDLPLLSEHIRRQIQFPEEMSKHKKIALGIGAGAAALGGAYLAHKHGYIPNFHSAPVSHGMGWKSKAAIALGTAAALGTAGYAAHRSGAAGDAVSHVVGKVAQAAEKHGLTNEIPRLGLLKYPRPVTNIDLDTYGRMMKGYTRDIYHAYTNR